MRTHIRTGLGANARVEHAASPLTAAASQRLSGSHATRLDWQGLRAAPAPPGGGGSTGGAAAAVPARPRRDTWAGSARPPRPEPASSAHPHRLAVTSHPLTGSPHPTQTGSPARDTKAGAAIGVGEAPPRQVPPPPAPPSARAAPPAPLPRAAQEGG